MNNDNKSFRPNSIYSFIFHTAVVFLTILFALNSYGKVQSVNGIKWTYDVVRGAAVVRSIPKSTKGAITIPSKLGGYPVKAIAGQNSKNGVGAFGNCSKLTSITIPSSVVAIGTRSFYNCSKLKKITFLGNHPYFDFDYSINNYSHYIRYGAETFEKIPSSCIVYIPKGRDWSKWVSDLKSRVRHVKYSTTYYVTFNANGGKGKMTKQSITYGKAVKLKKNSFKKSNYIFAGWAKSKSGAIAYANGASVKNIITSGSTQPLYARWAKSKYKIAFYPNGGTGKTATQTFTYGKAAKLRANTFSRSGYVFAGWAKSASGAVAYSNTKSVKNLTMTGATIKLYAVWRAKSTYKYNANGGSGTMAAQSFIYGTKTNLKSNGFKRTGYTFQGWATTKTGKVAYKNVAQISSPSKPSTITLYAVWKPNEYKIVFNANGGTSSMAPLVATYDKPTKLKLNTFKRTDYKFAGWATTPTGSVKYKDGVEVKNLTSQGSYNLYAVWRAKTTLSFMANKENFTGSTAPQAIYYGMPEKINGNPFKSNGYTFIGWATTKTGAVRYKDKETYSPSSVIPAAVTLYAVWKPNEYKIVFNANDGEGSLNALDAIYDNPITLPNVSNQITRLGYTFQGWATTPTGKVAYENGSTVTNLPVTEAECTLYAVWDPKTYKIHFDANGGDGEMTPQEISFEDESTLTLTTNTYIKTDYQFVGWSTSANSNIVFKDCDEVNIETLKKYINESTEIITLYAVWEHAKFMVIDITGNTDPYEIRYYSELDSIPNMDEDAITGPSLVLQKVTDGKDIYYMGIYELTFHQLSYILKSGNDNASLEDLGFSSEDPIPSVSISYSQIIGNWNAYYDGVLQILREKTGLYFNLPTTNQWAHVCRAGNNNISTNNLSDIAWYNENSKGKPNKVGEKEPNAWGFYDMYGNVWEMCLPDNSNPGSPILMGGAYDSKIEDFSSIPSKLGTTSGIEGNIGIRLVVPSPTE